MKNSKIKTTHVHLSGIKKCIKDKSSKKKYQYCCCDGGAEIPTLDIILQRCSCDQQLGCCREGSQGFIELTLRVLQTMCLYESVGSGPLKIELGLPHQRQVPAI